MNWHKLVYHAVSSTGKYRLLKLAIPNKVGDDTIKSLKRDKMGWESGSLRDQEQVRHEHFQTWSWWGTRLKAWSTIEWVNSLEACVHKNKYVMNIFRLRSWWGTRLKAWSTIEWVKSLEACVPKNK